MKRTVWVVACATALVSCARQTKEVRPFDLLGLNEKRLVEQLGEPEARGVCRPDLQEYEYRKMCFNVMVESNTVTACAIRLGSPVRLDNGIGCGTRMEAVAAAYGPYTSEQAVKEGQTNEYVAGVLYRQTLTTGDTRYLLCYPDRQLRFGFHPDKTLHSIWVGKIY